MAPRKTKSTRRSFSPEYRAEVVEMVRQGENSLSQICRNLDLTETSVRNWVKQAEQTQGSSVTSTSGESEAEELKRLRGEVKQLRMERDILKKATAFFAREST